MSKKHCCLPPGKAGEILTRIEQLEENQAALEGAVNAFIVVFGIRRLPDQAEGTRAEGSHQ